MIAGDCATTSTEYVLAAEPFGSHSACVIQSPNLAQVVYAATIEAQPRVDHEGSAFSMQGQRAGYRQSARQDPWLRC